MNRFVNLFLIIVTVLIQNCSAQSKKEEVTFGNIFKEIEAIKTNEKLELRYEKSASFNFENFKPEGNPVDENDFYKVGFNEKGEIKEITHKITGTDCMSYTLVVNTFDKFKILLIKIDPDEVIRQQSGTTEFYKSAVLVVVDGSYFLLSLHEQFNHKEGHVSNVSGGFYRGSIDKLSAIMILDKKLVPRKLLKFSEKQLVQNSNFVYKKDGNLEFEGVGFFFNTPKHPAFRVENSTVLTSLNDEPFQSDTGLMLVPIDDGCNQTPLWFQIGAHSYEGYDYNSR